LQSLGEGFHSAQWFMIYELCLALGNPPAKGEGRNQSISFQFYTLEILFKCISVSVNFDY